MNAQTPIDAPASITVGSTAQFNYKVADRLYTDIKGEVIEIWDVSYLDLALSLLKGLFTLSWPNVGWNDRVLTILLTTPIGGETHVEILERDARLVP